MSKLTSTLFRKTEESFRIVKQWAGFALMGGRREALKYLRPDLLSALTSYPSVINSGYLHLERTTELARQLGVPAGGVICDVGAAEGQVALRFAAAFPKAQVFCFEPIPETFQGLRENVGQNERIHVRNVALGASVEKRQMQVTDRITCSSLCSVDAGEAERLFADQVTQRDVCRVEVSRLDDEIEPGTLVSILKLDVQGFEKQVLEGAAKTLEQTFLVLVEMQNHSAYADGVQYYELDEHLRQAGFRLYDMVPSIRRNQQLCEWDGIYVNERFVKRVAA